MYDLNRKQKNSELNVTKDQRFRQKRFRWILGERVVLCQVCDNFWVQCTNLTPKKNYGFLNKKTNWLNTILRKNNFRD